VVFSIAWVAIIITDSHSSRLIPHGRRDHAAFSHFALITMYACFSTQDGMTQKASVIVLVAVAAEATLIARPRKGQQYQIELVLILKDSV